MGLSRIVPVAAALALAAFAAAAAPTAAPVKAPPRPDVNVPIAVEVGLPKKSLLPERAHGYLQRRGAGNGQREGANDPGPPKGQIGIGVPVP